MRLSEIKYTVPDSIKLKIKSKLSSAGYTKLGSGVDSQVWAKHSDTVIKILVPQEGTAITAFRSFLMFYTFCQAHADNPHLPKFQIIEGAHFSKFKIEGKVFYQIAMERLLPLSGINKWLGLEMFMGIRKRKPFEKWYTEKLETGFSYGNLSWAKINALLQDPKFKVSAASLYKVMEEITAYIAKKDYDLDLDNYNNYMQRADGTIVIIDPWAGRI